LVLAVDEVPTPLEGGGVAVRTSAVVLKILDLGLARLSEREDGRGNPHRPNLTVAGTVMGTADYVAPEQARDSRQADTRTDIHALGCTFYYALAAGVPFPGGTPAEKMLKQQLDEPPPVEKLRPDIPPALAAILRCMMAKDPARRYQTPADLAAAVARLADARPATLPVAQPPPQAAAPSDDERLIVPSARADRRALRMSRILVWLVAVAGLLGLGVLTLVVLLWAIYR